MDESAQNSTHFQVALSPKERIVLVNALEKPEKIQETINIGNGETMELWTIITYYPSTFNIFNSITALL